MEKDSMKSVIHIFGASGSGTTTLGRRIAEELEFRFMDTDDYYWMPTDPPYTVKRPAEERVKLMLKDIEAAEHAVISGSLTDWGDVLIPTFTLAIRVHTDTQTRLERLKKRERAHFGSRIDKGGDMYEVHTAFMDWASRYETADTSTRSRAKHDEWQKLLHCEVMDVDGTDVFALDMDDIRQRIQGGRRMTLQTECLLLRPWCEEDAQSLYAYASDPEVGPPAGWPPHKSVEDSLNVIRHVLSGAECYAICLKEDGKAIGAIELMRSRGTVTTTRDDEGELGYWLGRPFWGKGYMPEAARALIRRGFEELGMNTIWCAYYEGNDKSKRVQEKLGFVHHHTCEAVDVPLLGETRTSHVNILTREMWMRGR